MVPINSHIKRFNKYTSTYKYTGTLFLRGEGIFCKAHCIRFPLKTKSFPTRGTYRVKKAVMIFTFTIKISNKEWPPRASTTSHNLAATTHSHLRWTIISPLLPQDRPRPAIISLPPLTTTDKTNHSFAATTHGFELCCKINSSKAIFKRLYID